MAPFSGGNARLNDELSVIYAIFFLRCHTAVKQRHNLSRKFESHFEVNLTFPPVANAFPFFPLAYFGRLCNFLTAAEPNFAVFWFQLFRFYSFCVLTRRGWK